MRPIGLMFRIGNVNAQKLIEYCQKNPHDFAPDPSKQIMNLEDDPPVFRPFGFFSLVKKGRQQNRVH